jgi:tetratricopeptide (TPR) repeat protein
MRVARVILLGLLATGAVGPLSAQIPTRRPRGETGSSTGPRVLVGNPHSYVLEDSSHSVAIGTALRERLGKLVNGQFRVLTRAEMNEALKQFGYPGDAILSPLPLRAFAQSLGARVLITSTVTHDAAGKHVITARLAGLNDDAGMVVSTPVVSSENHAELGTKVADGFAPALKVWADARACVDQSKTAPEKAAAAAKKVLGTLPTHGLANYCLGQLALARGRGSDSAQAMSYFQAAVKGDPMSLAAWTQLAAGYEVAGDTTQTVEALKQMLLIAPTNQPLRELAFKKFLAYGHPEIAEQVAEDGLKLDPSNTDLFELRANARAFRENYGGALDDLEQIVALDSARADSSFYVKYLVFASQRPDTIRLVRWSAAALNKFPENLTLLKQAVGAYSQVGLGDSLVGALGRLVKMDSAAAVGFALQEAKTRQDAKDYKGSDPFIAFAAKNGDAQARDGAAAFMLQGVTPMLQPPQNWQLLADSARAILQYANPTGRVAPIASHFLGLSLVNLIAAADKQAEAQKSCDLAKSIEAMTAEASAAFASADSYTAQKQPREQMQGYLSGLKPRTASMIKVYCK